MSGKVIDLAARRGRAGEPPVCRVPLAVQAEPDAVCLTLPGIEFWFTPGQALELARDLEDGAAAALAAEGPRPRGA